MNSKSLRLALVPLLLSATCGSMAAETPAKLLPPEPVMLSTGQQLDVGNMGFASPHYRDMDGDKIPDLLVGELGLRALRVYKNHGSATRPVFSGFDLLETTEGIALSDNG